MRTKERERERGGGGGGREAEGREEVIKVKRYTRLPQDQRDRER